MKEWKLSSFILEFLKKHIPLVILLTVSILGAALSGIVPPYILRYIIDTYFTNSSGYENLAGISVLYYASYLLIGLFNVFETYMISLFGQKLIHALRLCMMEKPQKMKPSYFSAHGSGEIESRIMDDVYSIETLFASGLVSILVSLIKIIGIMVSIFSFSWLLGLIILALLPLIFFITSTFRKAMLKRQLANRKLINAQSNALSETIDCERTIHNLNKEKWAEDNYAGLLEKSYKALDKTAVYDSVYSPIITMLKTLAIGGITLLVFYGTKNSDFLSLGLTVGTYAAAIAFISNIFSPINELGQELQSMQEGISGTERVKAFMNEKEINRKDKTLSSDKILKHHEESIISIRDLSFHYEDGDHNVLNHLSIEIKDQEHVTIIGRTGAGKTTLFKLILGIELPTEGKILINGADATKIPDKEKRYIFGYVSQGFKAIEGTIEDQITLKDKHISEEKVREVMKEVYLDEYVLTHIKGGYSAKFIEADFSRGQLQLLSLARALVADPKILLLDEISANLDSKTEEEIISALGNASDKRTVISISHRLSDQLGFDRTIEIK